jgi:hypothetical protein
MNNSMPQDSASCKKDWTPKRCKVPFPSKVQVVCLDDIERWATASVKACSEESESTYLGDGTPPVCSSAEASSKASSKDSEGSDKSSDTEETSPPRSPNMPCVEPMPCCEPESPSSLSPASRRLGWSPRLELPPTGFLRLPSAYAELSERSERSPSLSHSQSEQVFSRPTFQKQAGGWSPRVSVPLAGFPWSDDDTENTEEALTLPNAAFEVQSTEKSPAEKPGGSGWSPRMTVPLSETDIAKDWNSSTWFPAPSPDLPVRSSWLPAPTPAPSPGPVRSQPWLHTLMKQ